jgi:hypothetical protein
MSITIVRSDNCVVGIYLGDDLVCTHDKHSREEDIELAIAQRGGKDPKVKEIKKNYAKTSDLPSSLKEVKGDKPKPAAGPKLGLNEG